MKNRVLKYLSIAISLYVVLVTLVYVFQNWLTFPGGLASEAERALYVQGNPHQIAAIHFEPLPGITLEGFHQLGPLSETDTLIAKHSPLVLFMDGNADDTWASIPLFSKVNLEVKSLNYPGFGLSEGSPSEDNIDEFLLKWIISLDIDPTRPVIWVGRSLGTGIVTKLLYHLQIQKIRDLTQDQLILITPYNSLWKIGQHRFPWLPVESIMNSRYETENYLYQLKLNQVKVVLTEKDWVVPHQFSRDLLQVTQAQKICFKIHQFLLKGFHHNNVLESDELADIIQSVNYHSAD